MSNAAIHPETTLGHVPLSVSNLDRAVVFYLEVFAHHQEDGSYQVEVVEADIGFPLLLVIDRGR